MPAIIHRKTGYIYIYDAEEIHDLIRMDLVKSHSETGKGFFVFETDEFNNPKIKVMIQDECPVCGHKR
jgi:hypothetical protein